MLNLNHLRYFYVCAQNKNVTRAAKILGISQPSLSQRLKAFESEIGSKLFIRNGRGFDLSPTGKVLYEESKHLFEIAESLSNTLEGQDLTKSAAFRIGVSDEIERPFVAEIVGKLLRSKANQRIKFDVISRDHESICESLGQSKFDLVITNLPVGKKSPAYIFDFPVHLVTSKKQKEFKHINEMNLNAVFQILDEELIVPSKGMVLRDEIQSILKKLPSPPQIAFESNILACTVRAICEGVGCGFLPLPYIRHDYKQGLLSIVGPSKGYWRHRVYFYANPRVGDLVVKNLAQVVNEYND
jgi:LysR family transcriptional activator of nhaA